MSTNPLNLISDLNTQDKYRIFCDLDGVLVNFKEGITKALQSAHGNHAAYDMNAYGTDPKYRNIMWKAIAKWQEENGPTLWAKLPPMPDYLHLWHYISKYDTCILSATGQDRYQAVPQKIQWVEKHLGPNIKTLFVKAAPLKAEYAGKNHILIDDQMRAIQPWIDNGGIGIQHTSASSTIEQLKKLGL